MRKVFTTRRFDRRLSVFLKFHPGLAKKVKETMKVVISDPFTPSLKTHKLSGPLKECLSSSITYEHRIVFVLDENSVYFIDIGPHDKVY